MKQIVIQSHTSRLGGAELCLLDLCENLLYQFDAHITVILPDHGLLESRLKGIPNVSSEIIHSRWWVSPNRRLDRRLVRNMINYKAELETADLLREIKPDLAISNTICTPVLAKAVHKKSIPHVWFVHEMTGGSLGLEFQNGAKSGLNEMFKLSENVIFNSETVRNFYLDAEDKRRTKTDVLYPRVDLPEMTFDVTNGRNKGHQASGIRHQASGMKIINVGAIQPGKQQHLLLEIGDLLQKSKIDFQIDFIGSVGDYVYKSRLDELVALFHLDDRVRFLGFQDDTFSLMKKADVLVHCGMEEGFGRVIAEAFSAKLPVLMFHSGSAEELIGDNERGCLFSSSEEAAHIIGNNMSNPEKLEKTTESAFHFTQNFGTLFYDKNVISIVEDFLGPPNLEV